MKGKVLRKKYITRSDLKKNIHALFVFGDNMAREGYGGQAASMRGEPNAVGIPTKWVPMRTPGSFFCDNDFDRIKITIDFEIAKLRRHIECGGNVIIPSDGIGTGLADLPNKAPRIFEYIQAQLVSLESL